MTATQQRSAADKKHPHHGAAPATPVAFANEPMIVKAEAIAKRAYEKFEARGCEHGHDQEDWAAAAAELAAGPHTSA